MSLPARRILFLAALLGAGFFLPGLLAPWLAPHDPLALDLAGALAPPSPEYPLGRDEQGADILSRLLHGARISLLVGLATTAVSAVVGIAVGLVAGTLGGWVEQALMRLVDVLLAFPGLLLAIALVAVLGPGLSNVVIALAALGWTGFARLVRGQVLEVKARDDILAARALGVSEGRMMAVHILPNIMAPVIVQASFAIAGAILAEASLSFLGLGAPPGTPSWGAMLAEGITPALIENAGRMAGMPVGALALADEVSIELMYKIKKQTKDDLGDKYVRTSVDDVGELMVELGRIGKKVGKGFYEYPKDGKKHLWPGLKEHFPLADDQPDVDEVIKRLLYVQSVETARCLEENVVTDPRDADVGSVMGWAFPASRGGTASQIDTIGVSAFVAECD